MGNRIARLIEYLSQAPLAFPYRLIFELCLYKGLNGPLFHWTLCGASYHLFLATAPPFAYTVLCLLVCLCVPWFNRTFPGELSALGGQTVCCPLWCLCRELVLWEQLFREQILINGRMCLFFLPDAPYFCQSVFMVLPLFFAFPMCVWLCITVLSHCRLTLGVPQQEEG